MAGFWQAADGVKAIVLAALGTTVWLAKPTEHSAPAPAISLPETAIAVPEVKEEPKPLIVFKVLNPMPGDSMVAGTLTVRGTGLPGASVEVTYQGKTLALIPVSPTGEWAQAIDLEPAPKGDLVFRESRPTDVLNVPIQGPSH